MEDGFIKIEQLRKWRSRKKKELRLDTEMNSFCRSLKKTNSQLLQLREEWNELVPTLLSQVAIPVAFRNGVLEVSVDGSPTAYQINRLVRSGLLRQLQKKCNGTLRQIRVRIG